ncbi:hypothetical protein CMO83_04490 [Candidatus Woesearchaeota archaeon]|nr:hypothetical protein [Candidatus Woesearchaeota archaeon]MDP6648432.1 hypothetical protein [Candidatus Woesearchaeota archaeon]
MLIVGILIGVVGFLLINNTFLNNPVINWSFVTSIFLWLLLIFVVILTDSNESIKEELGTIIKEHIGETRLLKKEITLLREVMSKKKK